MEAATDFILAPGLKLVHRAAKVATIIIAIGVATHA
jgi:hypothetical protein